MAKRRQGTGSERPGGGQRLVRAAMAFALVGAGFVGGVFWGRHFDRPLDESVRLSAGSGNGAPRALPSPPFVGKVVDFVDDIAERAGQQGDPPEGVSGDRDASTEGPVVAKRTVSRAGSGESADDGARTVRRAVVTPATGDAFRIEVATAPSAGALEVTRDALEAAGLRARIERVDGRSVVVIFGTGTKEEADRQKSLAERVVRQTRG